VVSVWCCLTTNCPFPLLIERLLPFSVTCLLLPSNTSPSPPSNRLIWASSCHLLFRIVHLFACVAPHLAVKTPFSRANQTPPLSPQPDFWSSARFSLGSLVVVQGMFTLHPPIKRSCDPRPVSSLVHLPVLSFHCSFVFQFAPQTSSVDLSS